MRRRGLSLASAAVFIRRREPLYRVVLRWRATASRPARPPRMNAAPTAMSEPTSSPVAGRYPALVFVVVVCAAAGVVTVGGARVVVVAVVVAVDWTSIWTTVGALTPPSLSVAVKEASKS